MCPRRLEPFICCAVVSFCLPVSIRYKAYPTHPRIKSWIIKANNIQKQIE